jgi:hypothetical protein
LAGLNEVHADRVAHPVGVDLAPGAVPVHADDPADPGLVVELRLFRREHVEGLAERDIELVVRPDAADPGGVVIALLVDGDEFSLGHDGNGHHVGALVEELCRRIHDHPVLLRHVEKAILGETGAVGDGQLERLGETLHLVRHPVLVAVGHDPGIVLAGSDKDRDPLGANRHMAGVGDDCIELDLEARRQLDSLQSLANRCGIGSALFDEGEFLDAGRLHLTDRFEIGLGRRAPGRPRRQ